jgi:hypothetical protein
VVAVRFFDIRGAIDDGWTKVFVGANDKEVFGVLERVEQSYLVVYEIFLALGRFKKSEDVSFELLGAHSEFGWNGLQGRVPVGSDVELFWWQFVAGEIDLKIKISLESSEVLLQLFFVTLGSGAEIQA